MIEKSRLVHFEPLYLDLGYLELLALVLARVRSDTDQKRDD